MPKFRKKPIILEAVRLSSQVVLQTLEGEMRGERGDWLVTGVEGEQHIVKDRIFRQIYEPVDSFWVDYDDGDTWPDVGYVGYDDLGY